MNEKTGTIAELWDGHNLKCTFRRTVSECLGRVLLEIVQLASNITLNGEEDALIWRFTSNGIYSSQSMYRVVNFPGVRPIFLPSIWSLSAFFFLWLLFKNKTLTRDSLAKKQKVNNKTCIFCEELETSQHLFLIVW